MSIFNSTIAASLFFLCLPVSFATASGQQNTCEQNLINGRIEAHLNSLGQVSNPRIVACVASDLESDRSAQSLCNELKVDFGLYSQIERTRESAMRDYLQYREAGNETAAAAALLRVQRADRDLLLFPNANAIASHLEAIARTVSSCTSQFGGVQ